MRVLPVWVARAWPNGCPAREDYSCAAVSVNSSLLLFVRQSEYAMEEYDPADIRELAYEVVKHLGLKTFQEARVHLEETIKRSDGPMEETFRAFLTIIKAAEELD